jgi:hypothetical protein
MMLDIFLGVLSFFLLSQLALGGIFIYGMYTAWRENE